MPTSPPPPPPPPGSRYDGTPQSGYVLPATGEWQKGANKTADIALWLMLGGFFCFPPLHVAAVIVGFEGLKKSRLQGGDGRTKSMVALVISAICCVGMALALLVALIASAVQQAPK